MEAANKIYLKRGLMRIWILIARVGLIASVIIHFSSYLGFNLLNRFPFFLIFHFLVFVVIFPAVTGVNNSLYSPQSREFLKKSGYNNQFQSLYRIFLRNVSPSLIVLCGLFLAYFIVYFFLVQAISGKNGSPKIINGEKVLVFQGKIVRYLSSDEFKNEKLEFLRRTTAHWMFMFCFSLMMLKVIYKEKK